MRNHRIREGKVLWTWSLHLRGERCGGGGGSFLGNPAEPGLDCVDKGRLAWRIDVKPRWEWIRCCFVLIIACVYSLEGVRYVLDLMQCFYLTNQRTNLLWIIFTPKWEQPNNLTTFEERLPCSPCTRKNKTHFACTEIWTGALCMKFHPVTSEPQRLEHSSQVERYLATNCFTLLSCQAGLVTLPQFN